jgi:hypothetical protein
MALLTRQSPYSLSAAALVFEFMLMLSLCARGAHYSWVNPELILRLRREVLEQLVHSSADLYVLSDVLESVSDPAGSIRHELRIRPFFEDDVRTFPRFVIDQTPFVA